MEEWWRQSHELIVKHRPTRELLRHAVEMNKQIQLRFVALFISLKFLNKLKNPIFFTEMDAPTS
jgi:hypothetical protein